MTQARRWLTAALAPALLLIAAPTASAADRDGRIDHVEVVDGEVTVLYSVPGLAVSENPDLSSIGVTVNGDVVGATAEPIDAAEQDVRRTSILAIDVSKSMQGAKFDAARQAALTYIDNAPSDVYVGLVTFASEVETLVEPTQDRDTLGSAVDSLSLTLETRLFDGVLQALDVAGTDGVRSVLLLSDGKDTSETALKEVTAAASAREVRVDAVALDQEIDESSPLSQIATSSGGGVTQIQDASDLEALFAEQAAELSKQLVVTFPQPAGVDGDVTLDVSVAAGGDTYADDALVSLEPAAGSDGAPNTYAVPGGFSLSGSWLLGGVVLLFIGFGALLVIGLSNAGKAELTPMQQQLQLYTVHGMDTHKWSRRSAHAPSLKDSAVAVADKFVKGQGFEERLATKLDRAGLKFTASEWVLLHIGIAMVAPFAGLVLSGNIFVVLLLFVLGAVLPWLYLSFKESRRIKAFNGQLAQTLQIIAGALQGGLSLPQAVDTVVQEGAEPVAGEFRRAIIEQRLGVDIEDTLDTVAERMDSKDFKWVVMAVRIQREVGGNLAELLLTVSATLREREYLRRQVQVLSAEGRMSAWILGGLPPFFFGYLALLRPEYLEPMLENRLGWIMLGMAVVLISVGAFWLKKMVKVEV